MQQSQEINLRITRVHCDKKVKHIYVRRVPQSTDISVVTVQFTLKNMDFFPAISVHRVIHAIDRSENNITVKSTFYHDVTEYGSKYNSPSHPTHISCCKIIYIFCKHTMLIWIIPSLIRFGIHTKML